MQTGKKRSREEMIARHAAPDYDVFKDSAVEVSGGRLGAGIHRFQSDSASRSLTLSVAWPRVSTVRKATSYSISFGRIFTHRNVRSESTARNFVRLSDLLCQSARQTR
jgi:hypothetical protein